MFATFPLRAQTAPAPLTPIAAQLAAIEEKHRIAYQAAKYNESVAASRTGLELADRAGTLTDQLQFLRHLAYENWLLGDNESAIEYSQRVLETADRLNDDHARSQGHRYLSQIYGTLGDDLRAHEHAREAMRFAQLSSDGDLRVYALTEIGLSEARAKHYDSALKAFEECHVYWEKQKRPWNAVNSLVNIAEVSEAKGDLAGALKRHEEILAARKKNNDLSGQARTVIAIASLLCRLGRADEALPRLTATWPLAETIGSHRIFSAYYDSLARVQEARHDFAAALAAERQAATERELLTGEHARYRAAELESRLDVLQKQQAIDQLRTQVAVHEAQLRAAAADLAQDRSFRIVLIDGIVAAVIAALSGWLVIRYRERSRRLHAAVADALKSNSRPPFAD